MKIRELKRRCIFCGKDKHLYINFSKKVYHCFKCNKSGKLNANLLAKLNISIPKIIPQSSKTDSNLTLRKLGTEEPFFSYAKNRGALKFKDDLFLCKEFPNYLIIGLPLGNSKKNFYFGRKVLLAGPRYRYFMKTEEMIAKSFQGTVKKALIVEGFFDLCYASKVIPTIALLGKDFNELKIQNILKNVSEEILISLDKDAIQEALKLSLEFSKKRKVRVLWNWNQKDFGEGTGIQWLKLKL